MTKDDFIKRSLVVHGDKYIYDKVLDEFKANDDITIICPIHGEFNQSARSHYRGHGCSKCKAESTRKTLLLNTSKFLDKYHKKFGQKYDTSLVDYKDFDTDVKMICHKHGIFEATPHELMRGKGCPKCGNERSGENRRLSREEVIERANKIHNFKYNYDKYNGEKLSEVVTITCPIHGDFPQTMRKHLMGSGCRKCGYEKNRETQRRDINDVIEECKKIHNNKYQYILDFEYINNKSELHAVCPKHGDFNQIINSHLRGEGCPYCKTSLLENSLMDFLDGKEIKYEHEKKFSWLGNQRLDFYLPQYNTAIECQGQQHFTPVSFGGNTSPEDNYKLVLEYDNKKRKLCEENGVKLLYYSNLGIEYPYKVYEDLDLLLENVKT